MIPSSTDYNGRLVDLEYLQTISKPSGSYDVTQSIAISSPKIVTGIQKLVQRYAIIMLTRLGDVYLAPNKGTGFLDRIARGGGRSRGHILQTFAFANIDVIRQLREDDGNTDTYGEIPADEQIRRAELLDYSVDFTTSTLSLTVFIESNAGESFTYVIPVTVPRT